MDCYVILHSEFRSIKSMPWVHQTFINNETEKYYITNTIKPVMSKNKTDKIITFVYNKVNYLDFINYKIEVH